LAEINKNIAIVEAILFACGEAVNLEKLAEAAGISRAETVQAVDLLERRYNVSDSGIQVLRLNKGYQLATREEFTEQVKKSLENRRQAPLSQPAMEVLAITAYNEPVTKSFIEQVRGIDSGSVVNTLVERGLLEEGHRLDLPGRPVTFKTTDTFLRSFGLISLAELPAIAQNGGFEDNKELPLEEEIEFIQDDTETME
jgi:segregation and condensation protein B